MDMTNKTTSMLIMVSFWVLGVIMAIVIFIVASEPREVLVVEEVEEVIHSLPRIVRTVQPMSYTEISEPRYGFTDEDIYLMAQLLCGDKDIHGDGEYDFVWGYLNDEMNYYEMSKVLCIVMNRVQSEGFPDTVRDVIMQKGQFQDSRNINTIPDDIALEMIGDWCIAYDRWDPAVQSIPENHYFYDGDGVINHTREVWR